MQWVCIEFLHQAIKPFTKLCTKQAAVSAGFASILPMFACVEGGICWTRGRSRGTQGEEEEAQFC